MVQYDTAQRAAALALKVYSASNGEIEHQTKVKTRALNYIFKKTEQHGFNPATKKGALTSRIAAEKAWRDRA